MTQASSSYKSYDRQPRVLTEETGFSGGMRWTDNSIAPTHLRAIVNFDYDDTTGFLKTRAPIVPTLIKDKDDVPLLLSQGQGLQFIGAYNICAAEQDLNTLADTELEDRFPNNSPAGLLYIFGDVSLFAGVQSCTRIQCVYKTATGLWYSVDCSAVNEALQENGLRQYNKLTPVIADSVLYWLNSSTTSVFTAWRLTSLITEDSIVDSDDGEATVTDAPVSFKLDVQPYDEEPTAEEGMVQYPWETYESLINRTTLLEASVTGYNAARGENTFKYESLKDTDPSQNEILGVYLTDVKTGDMVVSPRVGQEVYLNIVINGYEYWGDDHCSIQIYKLKDSRVLGENPSDNWECLTPDDKALAILPTAQPIQFAYTFDAAEVTTFHITLIEGNTMNDPYDTSNIAYALSSVEFKTNNFKYSTKVKPYDVTTATSSCLWGNRMVLWGCTNYDNTLFISAIDNFYYFPVPNNVALFDSNIISCIPYLGSLLVFTADKIYKLTEDSAGVFTQEVIQNDMPITQDDATYLRAIKNMVLFKSGKYYYMVVPKSQSLTGELTIAPISKNIAGFLNNMPKAIEEVLTLLYPERIGTNTVDEIHVSDGPAYIYSEQDDVRILYDVTVGTAYRFMVFLNYNTNMRAWTLYVEETTSLSLAPTVLTASRIMSFIRTEHTSTGVRLYTADLDSQVEVSDSFRSLIDTGYRVITGSLKKRFREVQLKLYCASENTTAFGSSFLIDGVTRRSYMSLKETYVDSQTVALTPSYDLNTFITEPRMTIDAFGHPAHLSDETQQTNPPQGSDRIELSDWKLDFSHFKRGAPTTVRVPVSGKGYSPRFILMTPSSNAMCLNEINWVYRMMYGR